jgi:hypothetical protein
MVTLHTRQGDSLQGVLCNMSCGGAFISMAPDPRPMRGMVEIEFELPYAEPRRCRWRAYVVHQQGDGVGVMFDDGQLHEVLPYLAAEKMALRLQPRRPPRAAARIADDPAARRGARAGRA